jgi:predicted DNA-binding protein
MKKSTSIRLPEEDKEKLEALCKRSSLSQTLVLSALINQAESIEMIVKWKTQTKESKTPAKPTRKP